VLRISEYFLKSLPSLIKAVPNVRIILCGDDPLRNKFERFVKNCGIEDRVHFAGFVDNDGLPKYYNSADIYVSTSLSDGTSLSLLEAMASGLPVVVTDVPAIKEWVQDGKNGFVVPRRDSKTLAKKIVQLLQDETRQKEFGDKNIKIAKERADGDKNFEKLERIYTRLYNS
jgi:glycosyltransferase involved in cell wall biosynthesis